MEERLLGVLEQQQQLQSENESLKQQISQKHQPKPAGEKLSVQLYKKGIALYEDNECTVAPFTAVDSVSTDDEGKSKVEELEQLAKVLRYSWMQSL